MSRSEATCFFAGKILQRTTHPAICREKHLFSGPAQSPGTKKRSDRKAERYEYLFINYMLETFEILDKCSSQE